jgi:DNA repair photolyase/predicted metal-dependent hydrolase
MKISYTLTRSKRKTIAIHVHDGGVEVRAPLKMPKRNIDRFVLSKEKWIKDKLKSFNERMEQREKFSLNYGDTVMYRGKEYPIVARSGDLVGFDDELELFYMPPSLSPERIKAAVIQIYKMLAKNYLAERLLHYQPIMGVSVTDFNVTNAKKRWGSMNGKKSVNFSWRLIMADDDVIDYIVVHELAHIIEMNHSARFRAVVGSFLPDWKEREKRLKEFNNKLSVENWDVNWEAAAKEENVPLKPDSTLFRWHYADYKTILSPKNGMNLYRGCTHGCIYCDSRSDCYQMNHDFEDIEVKRNAVMILEEQMRRKRQTCVIGTGAMCDPYIHLEEELRITRHCLELIEKHGFGLAIQTKSARIKRDMDILKAINAKAKCVVQMSLTTYDEDLCRIIEPNVSTTAERVAVLEAMRDAGIPTVVWLTPILPFINDTEENLRGLLDYCIVAKVQGIICFGFGTTMRDGSREHFYKKLDEQFPGMKQKYIRVFGNSYECPSPNNAHLTQIFQEECKKHAILHKLDDVFEYIYRLDHNTGQMSLFD